MRAGSAGSGIAKFAYLNVATVVTMTVALGTFLDRGRAENRAAVNGISARLAETETELARLSERFGMSLNHYRESFERMSAALERLEGSKNHAGNRNDGTRGN